MAAASRSRRWSRRGVAQRPPRPSRVDTAAPELCGVTPRGDAVRIDTGGDAALVVAFLTSSCMTCQPFWKVLAGAGEASGTAPALVVVTPDPTTEDRREIARRAGPFSPVVMSSAAWFDWGATGSPFFVVVAGGYIRAEGVARDWKGMLELIPAS